MSILNGPVIEAVNSQNPKKIVIFCHGYGADGNDLISLANYFQPTLPDAVFLSPNAPEKCGMSPMGYQWFDFQSGDPATIWKGVLTAADTLNNFIDEQLEHYNLTDQDLALVGFSQGTMMSLHVGLRRLKPIRAIVGFSGRLIAPELLDKELKSKPPIYLIHGDADPMVPYQDTIEAEKKLKGIGLDVKAHISPNTPHSIAQDGLSIAIDFITEKFSN